MKWQHDIGCSSSNEKGSATVESTPEMIVLTTAKKPT